MDKRYNVEFSRGLELMAICTYDNPATMCRECWQDGKLLCSYNVALMMQKGQWPPPPRYFFFGANIGDWKTGQMVGDSAAMRSNAKLTGTEPALSPEGPARTQS